MALVLHGQFPVYVHCSFRRYRSCHIRHQRRQCLLLKGIDSHDMGKEARHVCEYATHMKLMVRYGPCRPSDQQTCTAHP